MVAATTVAALMQTPAFTKQVEWLRFKSLALPRTSDGDETVTCSEAVVPAYFSSMLDINIRGTFRRWCLLLFDFRFT
jgi:hypothetical protein